MTIKTSYRSGLSFARGVTVDLLLEQPDVDALYEKWDNSWGEPLEFQGGQKAITCNMIYEAPLKQLVKVFGKARAERLLEAAKPYREV